MGRPAKLFLKMNEGARQLNEAFVEKAVGSLPLRKPEFFKHVVRLVEKLAVETREVTEIMSVKLLSPKGRDQRRDLLALLTHGRSIKSKV